MKECGRCRRAQPLTNYNRQSKSLDGYQNYCRRCQKVHKYLNRYNLTETDLALLLYQQGGECAICHTLFESIQADKVPLVVDHDHQTGRVRGLLCNNCNIVLGHAKDDAEILASAIRYLEDRSKR